MSVSTRSTTSKRAIGRLASNKPSGVCLNRKDLRSVAEVAVDHSDAESMYLRENELTRFDVDVKLDALRVLDLSINDIGGAVDFLKYTPHLHHLFMTGNRIETLAGIANFASLETLCLSDNAITSFHGLENLPNLRVLSLNFNNIASFEAYPTLPSLHTLNMVGNPVTEVQSYRSMAIAINNVDLVSIDGNPVQAAERAAVEHYRGKVAYCIREGFVVEGDDAEEAADRFLLQLQRERESSKPLQLCAIRMRPEDETSTTLMEGAPITLSLCMQDIRPYSERTSDVFHSRYLYPVIFKVSGEAKEVFVVGSMNNWTDPIELERCEDDEVYFHTTLYLPAGDYEYRYIVDGVEKVSETNRITSKYKQGYCNLYQVTELENNDDEEDTILHIRWMHSNERGIYDVVEGQNGLVYVPALEDVGTCLRAEVLAYIKGQFSFLYFDISSPVLPAPPSCPHLELKGVAAEGAILAAEADYIGGVEGNSSLQWYRVTPDGQSVPVDLRDPWAGYKCTREDIGCRIRVEFSPVRNDWVAGEPKSAESDVVAEGQPTCESIKILGTLVEGSPLEVEVEYTGGEEGDSFFQWLRKIDGREEYQPIEGENSTKYVPTAADIGKRLAVEYTPVNTAGKEGETCRSVLEYPIEPKAPVARGLAISGDLLEDQVLTLDFQYSGGQPGEHIIQWFRRANGRQTKTGKANSQYLTLTNKDVGSSIEVTLTPVRADGVQGRPMQARAIGTVRATEPELKSFDVDGEPEVNQALTIAAEYTGGREGASVISWELQDPDTEEWTEVAAGATKYVIKKHDQGKMIRVTYVPVRDDGVQGEAQTFETRVSGEVQPPTPPPQSRAIAPVEVAAEPTPVETAPAAEEEKPQEESTHEDSEGMYPVEDPAPATEEDAKATPATEEPEKSAYDSDADSSEGGAPHATRQAPEAPEAATPQEPSPKSEEEEQQPQPEPEEPKEETPIAGNIHIDPTKAHDSDEDSDDEL